MGRVVFGLHGSRKNRERPNSIYFFEPRSPRPQIYSIWADLGSGNLGDEICPTRTHFGPGPGQKRSKLVISDQVESLVGPSFGQKLELDLQLGPVLDRPLVDFWSKMRSKMTSFFGQNGGLTRSWSQDPGPGKRAFREICFGLFELDLHGRALRRRSAYTADLQFQGKSVQVTWIFAPIGAKISKIFDF